MWERGMDRDRSEGEKGRGKSGVEVGRKKETHCSRTWFMGWKTSHRPLHRHYNRLLAAGSSESTRARARTLHTRMHMTQESTVCSIKQTPKDREIQQRKRGRGAHVEKGKLTNNRCCVMHREFPLIWPWIYSAIQAHTHTHAPYTNKKRKQTEKKK